MSEFRIRSKRVVTPEGVRGGDVSVRGGVIVSVGEYGSAKGAVTDVGEGWLLPGVVDVHVHCNEPGRTAWEGFETATRAAAAGGITTIVDMPLNSSPVTTSVEAFQRKLEAARGKLSVDVAFHGGLIRGNGRSVGALLEAGCVGVKAFLVHSGIEEFPNAGEEDLREAMAILARLNVPLLVHAELEGETSNVQRRTSNVEGGKSYEGYLASRPNSWEHAAIEMMIRLCREYRCPVHIVHLAAADALPMLQAARAEGLPITVETCPHYLYFDASMVGEGDTRFKSAPPIRDAANREGLWEGLLSGGMDLVASDHSPCEPSLKQMESGDFTKAWGGISSLQFMLPAVWTEAKRRGVSLERVVRWLSEEPAKLVRLAQKGAIAVGRDADLVVFDPEATFEVRPEGIHHRHKVTPYEGRRLSGVVRETYARGQKVYDGRQFASPPVGRVVLRRPMSGVERLNAMSVEEARGALARCCGSRRWVGGMMKARPFADVHAVMDSSHKAWGGMNRDDWMEAFSHHPKIGDVSSLREKFASTAQWAAGEQAGATAASEKVLATLAKSNAQYEGKFGYIFIVCATGKSASEMLAILESRLPNPGDKELAVAAEEQKKITRLRLEKLLA